MSGTTDQPDYITFSTETGVLSLTPLIGDPVGVFSIDMIVSLTNYGRAQTQTFDVSISSTNDCAFDVISFANNFDEETYTFSVPVNTLTFDPMIQQTVSNCPRQCSFYENTQPLTLPSLFVSDVNEQTGAVSFASGTTYLDDSVFCMLIVCESLDSQMPDDQRITFDRFTVRFEIDCSQDEINFVSDFNTIDYYPAIGQPYSVFPIFTQTFSSCPVSCQVRSPFLGYTQPSFIVNVDDSNGQFAIFEQNAFGTVGQTINMEVICESVLSGASTTDTFDIAFKD